MFLYIPVGFIFLTPINSKTVCFFFNNSFTEITLNCCVQHYSNGFFVYLIENINNVYGNGYKVYFIFPGNHALNDFFFLFMSKEQK